MKPTSFMLIAGEASGDRLAAELIAALREQVLRDSATKTDDVQPLTTELAPAFFGAGGPHMARAGVDLAFDLTQHSVIGISEVLKKYFEFRRLFNQLFRLALNRQPDVIIGVDYGGFNLRFASAIKDHIRKHRGEFKNWNPKIVQYVSPQVWASRAGRAQLLETNHDLLLSIFPFETDWYARHAPKLRVEFVGHRLAELGTQNQKPETSPAAPLVLLPGSRPDELRRHLPVLLDALKLIRKTASNITAKIVLPNDATAQQARAMGLPAGLEIQVGDLLAALKHADVAITKSGTVTLECAAAGVPAVVFYKTSWPTYWIAKRILTVKYLAMPNLLAGEEIYPEFIQSRATPQNIAAAAVELLRDEGRRNQIKTKLSKVIGSLGEPGANERAAKAILNLLD